MYGPDVWSGGMVLMYGPDVWSGCMVRRYGPEVWSGCMVRMYGPDVGSGCMVRWVRLWVDNLQSGVQFQLWMIILRQFTHE